MRHDCLPLRESSSAGKGGFRSGHMSGLNVEVMRQVPRLAL